MKIRIGFVSNSSSSSYVCEITGKPFEIWDECFDGNLRRCIKGHIFQEEFLVSWDGGYPSREKMLEKLDDVTDSKEECKQFREMPGDELKVAYDQSFKSKGDCNIDECPICTMTRISSDELLLFLLKKAKLTREKAEELIRHKFKRNFVQFKNYIKDANQ